MVTRKLKSENNDGSNSNEMNDKTPLSPLPNSNNNNNNSSAKAKSLHHQSSSYLLERRQTFVVVFTFYASIISFFAVGCYDFTRPFIQSQLYLIIEKIKLATSAPATANNNNNTTLSWHLLLTSIISPVLSSSSSANTTSHHIIKFIEYIILIPSILSVLPLTKFLQKKQRRFVIFRGIDNIFNHHHRRSSSQQRRLSKDDDNDVPTTPTIPENKKTKKTTPSRQLCRRQKFILKLLDAVSWICWSSSFVIIMGAVHFVGSTSSSSSGHHSTKQHAFGYLTCAGLGAVFAQGLASVGLLWNFRSGDGDEDEEEDVVEDDDDDIRRESMERVLSVDGDEMRLMSADDWVTKTNVSSSSSSAVVLNTTTTSNITKNETMTMSPFDTTRYDSSRSSSSSRRNFNVDFLLFFLMNTGLIQTPYYLQLGLFLHHGGSGGGGYTEQQQQQQSSSIPKEIPGAISFVATILVPLFTHGVGGRMFGGREWSFHHPFEGGTYHVTAQAAGWFLLGFAALLQLCFLVLGLQNEHAYLLHSGSILSSVAEVTLLYSLLKFQPTSITTSTKMTSSETTTNKKQFLWYLFSFVNDLILTNMHWSYLLWLIATLHGFNAFSLSPFSKCFDISPVESLQNTALLLLFWSLPALLVPYSSRRRTNMSRWNIFHSYNVAFERSMFHPLGVFSDSKIGLEERVEVYKREGAMFAMAPHGTLPTSVFGVFYQFDEIFENVCVFFGSQVSMVPGYRFFLGMRGGCLPVQRKRLVEVMGTRQNVSLVPGGVHEMLNCVPYGKNINVSVKHKGFIRLAMQEGYDLVPTFFFHANDQYNNALLHLQTWTYKYTRIPIGIPFYSNKWLFPMSNRTPIRVALGRRIKVTKRSNPTPEDIDVLHRQFYEEVVRIWEKYKVEFGYGDRQLSYVR